jgi:hypothetical protein
VSVGIGVAWFVLLGSPGLSWAAPLGITITDASISLVPTQTDYETGWVEATGAAGIRVDVTTNNLAGLILYIRCDDGIPEITLSDLLVKCPTPGTLLSSFTAITGSDQALWSTDQSIPSEEVVTDVRIQGLWSYPDAAGGGTTDYTNTLTYTVVDQ